MITVYHNSNFANDSIVEKLTGTLTRVAVVFTPELDTAFLLTQNLCSPWKNNKRVVTDKEKDYRSTSAGDVFEHLGQFYFVSNIGFKKIRKPSKRIR